MPLEQLRRKRLGDPRDMGFGQGAAQRGERRKDMHDVADRAEADDQNPGVFHDDEPSSRTRAMIRREAFCFGSPAI